MGVEVVSLAIDATAGVGVTFGVGRITRHVVRRFNVWGLRWVRAAAARRGGVKSRTDADSVEILETFSDDYITRETDPSYPLGRESDTYPAIDILTHAYQHLVGSLLRVDFSSVGGANSILKPKKKRKDPPLPPMSFRRLSHSKQNSASFLPGRALTQCEPCIFGKQARMSAPTPTTRGSKLGAKYHECYLLGYPPGQRGHRVRSIATTLLFLDQLNPDIATTFELLDTAPTLQPPHFDMESSHSPKSSPAAVFTTTCSSHLQIAPSRRKAVRIRSREGEGSRTWKLREKGQIFEKKIREAAARRGGEGNNNPFVALCNSGVTLLSCAEDYDMSIPPSRDWEAEKRMDAAEWRKETEKELGDFKRMGSYGDVDELPEGKEAIGCRWVYEFKMNIYEARLVAQGFSRVPFVDHEATFALVAKLVTIGFVAVYSTLQGSRDAWFRSI